MLLFCLTTCVDFLPINGVHNLSTLFKSFCCLLAIIGVVIVDGVGNSSAMADGANARVERGGAIGIEAIIIGNIEFSESDKSDKSELSDSISILAGLYFLLCMSLSFIPFMSLKALITRKLLAWIN